MAQYDMVPGQLLRVPKTSRNLLNITPETSRNRMKSRMREAQETPPNVLSFIYSREVERSMQSICKASAIVRTSARPPKAEIPKLRDIYSDYLFFRDNRKYNVEREKSWRGRQTVNVQPSGPARLTRISLFTKVVGAFNNNDNSGSPTRKIALPPLKQTDRT